MIAQVREISSVQPKSKMKAGEGESEGRYKFFTSSNIQSKYTDKAQYKGPALIFGTGGNASVHYCEELFSVSTDCIVLYPLKDGKDLQVLYCYLQNNMQILENGFKGAGLKHISKDYILDIKFPLPEEMIKDKIIAKSKMIDMLICYQKEQLEKYDLLVKSRFVEMFGDPTDNSMSWDRFPLGVRCKIITGNTPPRAEADNYGSFLEWIKSDNINTPETYLTTSQEYLSEKGFEKCRYVEAGSILMTCIAGSIGCIGNVSVANRRVAFNQQINAIVPNEDETLYIYWLMQLSKSYIQSTVNMALKGILSKSQLSALEFPFPPIDRQRTFAAFVADIDKSKLAVKESLENLETLKKALMQQYFG